MFVQSHPGRYFGAIPPYTYSNKLVYLLLSTCQHVILCNPVILHYSDKFQFDDPTIWQTIIYNYNTYCIQMFDDVSTKLIDHGLYN